jgi:hypothetical protein
MCSLAVRAMVQASIKGVRVSVLNFQRKLFKLIFHGDWKIGIQKTNKVQFVCD